MTISLPKSLPCKAILASAMLLAAPLVRSPAMADVESGIDAWAREDYAAAIREWRAAADKGDADALFNLAQAYKLGRGVEQNLARAEELFGKAAAQGHMQAADNYGLLLFQRGEHAQALPYIRAASERGDPRAQYLLGLTYFNGEGVPMNWVMAYALVSLAHQAGLAQAAPALTEMDQYVPLEQRQQSVPLASQLAAQAQANRTRLLAASDLSMHPPLRDAAPAANALLPDSAQSMTGADYARPNTATTAPFTLGGTTAPFATSLPSPALQPAANAAPAKLSRTPAPAPAAPLSATGKWRIQLGAFAVPGNAEGMWKRLQSRPELAGHAPLFVKAGRLTLLQAGGFASKGQAQAACTRLSAAGFGCVPAGN